MYFASAGFSLESAGYALVLLPFGVALWLNEARTRRPLRSYVRLALASALLFLVLVVGVAMAGGATVLGCVMWLGMSALGLIWTIYYERTERLN